MQGLFSSPGLGRSSTKSPLMTPVAAGCAGPPDAYQLTTSKAAVAGGTGHYYHNVKKARTLRRGRPATAPEEPSPRQILAPFRARCYHHQAGPCRPAEGAVCPAPRSRSCPLCLLRFVGARRRKSTHRGRINPQDSNRDNGRVPGRRGRNPGRGSGCAQRTGGSCGQSPRDG